MCLVQIHLAGWSVRGNVKVTLPAVARKDIEEDQCEGHIPNGAFCHAQEPRNLASYRAHNIFLADINNDRDTKNPLYKDNLSTLEKFVMFRFEHDTTVVPRDSAWFAWYNGTQLLTMNQTDLYQVRLLHISVQSDPVCEQAHCSSIGKFTSRLGQSKQAAPPEWYVRIVSDMKAYIASLHFMPGLMYTAVLACRDYATAHVAVEC